MKRHNPIGLVLAAAVALPCGVTAASDSVLSSIPITEPAERGLPPYFATFDVTGIPSRGALGSGETAIRWLWIGPYNSVVGIGWDVVLRSVAPESWLTDIAVFVTDSTGLYSGGFGSRPAWPDRFLGGPTMYSSNGIVSLLAVGLWPVTARSDGLIRLEFFKNLHRCPGNDRRELGQRDSRVSNEQPDPAGAEPGMVGSCSCLQRESPSKTALVVRWAVTTSLTDRRPEFHTRASSASSCSPKGTVSGVRRRCRCLLRLWCCRSSNRRSTIST